jgi:hypothetical protein
MSRQGWWRFQVQAFSAAILALAILSGGALADVVQEGNLRITLHSQVEPYRLPRVGTAPIAVFLSGHVGTVDGDTPPQLQEMEVKVNKHGLLQAAGLPTCTLKQLQPASTARALRNCAPALVGSGRFWASVVFPSQRPYPTRGRLLIFNGRKGGRQVLFAHIYTRTPFSTSFVITFAIRRVDDGPYGTELHASFPEALGEWGFVDRIKLTLKRKYTFKGRHLSYFNAGCPAQRGTNFASFPLALAKFDFSESRTIQLEVTKSCRVSE